MRTCLVTVGWGAGQAAQPLHTCNNATPRSNRAQREYPAHLVRELDLGPTSFADHTHPRCRWSQACGDIEDVYTKVPAVLVHLPLLTVAVAVVTMLVADLTKRPLYQVVRVLSGISRQCQRLDGSKDTEGILRHPEKATARQQPCVEPVMHVHDSQHIPHRTCAHSVAKRKGFQLCLHLLCISCRSSHPNQLVRDHS